MSSDNRRSTETQKERIRKLNDWFRKGFGMVAGIPGTVAATAGIAGLPDDQKALVFSKVREFDEFTPDNDPHGEHDFGSIDVENVGKVFFKFDYYADESTTWGSEDPSDPTQSYRVMMIMFAHEYYRHQGEYPAKWYSGLTKQSNGNVIWSVCRDRTRFDKPAHQGGTSSG